MKPRILGLLGVAACGVIAAVVACTGEDPDLTSSSGSVPSNDGGTNNNNGDVATQPGEFGLVFPQKVTLIQGGDPTNVAFTIDRRGYDGPLDVQVQTPVGVTGKVIVPKGESAGTLTIVADATTKQGTADLDVIAIPDVVGVANAKAKASVLIRGLPGSPDRSFAVNGLLPQTSGLNITSLTAQQDGKILIALYKPGVQFANERKLLRYTAVGVLDLEFPNAGGPSNSVVHASVEPSGHTIAFSTFQTATYAKRWQIDGGLLPYSDQLGVTIADESTNVKPTDLAAYFEKSQAVAKVLTDGGADPTFKSGAFNGEASLSDRVALIHAIDVKTDGSLFVAGILPDAPAFRLGVFPVASTGVPGNALLTTSQSGYKWSSVRVRAGSLKNGARAFFAAGRANPIVGSTLFVVTRVVHTGAAMPAFGSAESITADQPWDAVDLAVQQDGAVVVLINTGTGHVLTRYLEDGTTDPKMNAKPVDDGGKADRMAIGPDGEFSQARTRTWPPSGPDLFFAYYEPSRGGR